MPSLEQFFGWLVNEKISNPKADLSAPQAPEKSSIDQPSTQAAQGSDAPESTQADAGPKGAEGGPRTETPAAPKAKRQWGPELYEFVFEHVMSVKNYDPNGLTEKITLAWLTPTGSRLRRAYHRCYGPYGIFINQYGSGEGLYYACVMELGASLVALGLAVLALRPLWWPFSLVLFVAGAHLILVSATQMDFWDVECEVRLKPKSLADRFEDYKRFCESADSRVVLESLEKVEPLGTDFVPAPKLGKAELPFIELENPEWSVISRKARLNFIASQIAASLDLRRVTEGRLIKTKILRSRFNLKFLRDDFLLLNDARELNGQCEYLISFAWLAPRSIKSRRRDGGFCGPLYAVRLPFVSAGGLVRAMILSALLWLASIGLVLLWYTCRLGLVYWIVSGTLIVVGLTGIFAVKRGIEN